MKIPFFNLKQTVQSQLTKATGGFGAKASPDELLGELFQDVQLRRIYPDGMTFVDLVPANKLRKVLRAYELQRQSPEFNLHEFVQKYFKQYLSQAHDYKTNPDHTIKQHINELWNVLTRENYTGKGSLVALPHPYIVPGGRFSAQWYWDTYFTMLGLAASGRWDLIEGMVKNFAFLIRKFGYIPSGNRTYYVGRSQPPFFSHMVCLLAEKEGKSTLVKYLPYMLVEQRFWMKGYKQLHALAPAYRRVVRMPDGSVLNRYYDNKRTPRPESYKEDVDTALKAPERIASQVYLDLRAAAESGWDFSSRWLKDANDLSSIHTTDIIPVDLNCLMVQLEQAIASTYKMLKQPLLVRRFKQKAEARIAAINKYCWSPEKGFYFDYDFVAKTQTPHYSLVAAFPLYAKIATQKQADSVAKVLKEKFLKDGGLVTTPTNSGQQWDSPNGWSALQWVAIVGLRNYGHNDLAEEIKKRWIATNEAIYKTEGKLVEKYNVEHVGHVAGGGEYLLQDGFGMTNGVLMALLCEDNLQNKQGCKKHG
ncbi:MAG: alpha,alpha-trehalase TreF [Candidatus Woesebacteria bacterium]|jgi:alpha,alpha-trehalase